MSKQTENPLDFATTDELLDALKRRSKTMFFAYEPLVDRELNWAFTWKAEGNMVRDAIALADDAIFKIRFDNRPIDPNLQQNQ